MKHVFILNTILQLEVLCDNIEYLQIIDVKFEFKYIFTFCITSSIKIPDAKNAKKNWKKETLFIFTFMEVAQESSCILSF